MGHAIACKCAAARGRHHEARAAGVHAVYLGTIEPYSAFSIDWTTTAINIVIIGGIGTLIGPIIGVLFVTLLAEGLADYQMIHLIITGLIMILVIRFLPAGIWGQLRRVFLPDRMIRMTMEIRKIRRGE